MKPSFYFMIFLFLSACSISPKEINYGSDLCDYCKMTIVDKQHSAQLVTKKGKAYLFDAIECMLPFKKENPEKVAALLLVADYQQPGQLIEAEQANYLISPSIPSPMGAYLSAFTSDKAIKAIQAEKGGKIFSYKDLENQFLKNDINR
ncbi:MAG: nitrous oxide reductase accessory protein NosL [Saprospiraceae bacterium]|nr:nitrous oxide reductase accessory protein NosL [Saprospiraceae bacterium]